MLASYWLAAGMVVIAAASAARSVLPLRMALALVGAIGLAQVLSHGWGVMPASACGALAIVNLVRLMLAVPWRGRVPMSAEESAMAARCFPSLSRHIVRLFLDEGLWVQGRAGEVIVHEGRPVTHLFYLADGSVAISLNGQEIARSGPGHFFGEITVLSGGPATATVTLTTAARLWCAPADGLRRFLDIHPRFEALLEAAFAGDLRAKLQVATSRMAAMAGADPAG